MTLSLLRQTKGAGLILIIIIFSSILTVGFGGIFGFAYYKGANLKSLNSIINIYKTLLIKDNNNQSATNSPENISPKEIIEAKTESCGNGVCEPPELKENCPTDCMEEVNTLSPEELKKDTDEDGLKDFEESWYGTNPKIPDSDSDGYPDGDELRGGYNPNGKGLLNFDFTTPEGTIMALENAKYNCALQEYENKFFVSDAYLDETLSIYSGTEGAKAISRDELITEIKNELLKEVLRDKPYVNKLQNFMFSEREVINSARVNLYYKIKYSPDDRGYTPAPKEAYMSLSKKDKEWFVDMTATVMGEFIALDKASQVSRDSKRLSDIKQIQTAADLYYADTKHYPEIITPGGQIKTKEGNVYLSSVPTNPKKENTTCPANYEYKYTIKENGESYELEYCLEGAVSNVSPGYNIATPSVITKNYDERNPVYKKCYLNTQ